MAYKRGTRRPLRKRWFVDARIGKNVPIIGGTGFAAGSGAKKKAAPLRRMIRREIYKQEEVKTLIANLSSPSGGMIHNTLYTNAPLQNLQTGTADGQRTGSQIFLRHLKIRGIFRPSVSAGQTDLRMLVVFADKQVSTPGVWGTGANSLSQTDLMYSTTLPVPHALLNNKQDFKLLCDRIIPVKYAGQLIDKRFEVDCPVFKKLTFNGVYNKEGNIYVVVVAQNNTVAGGSVVGTVYVDTLVTYVDA